MNPSCNICQPSCRFPTCVKNGLFIHALIKVYLYLSTICISPPVIQVVGNAYPASKYFPDRLIIIMGGSVRPGS